MITIFLITLATMLLVIAAMAVGVACNRAPIKGTCGGLNNANCCGNNNCSKRKNNIQHEA